VNIVFYHKWPFDVLFEMAKILISYRRASYDAIAGRIRDKLAHQYGSDAVYMDVDDIPFGIDFRTHIDEALGKADAVVAVIGPKWLGPLRGRKPRIFDDTDPVRIEIEAALKRQIAVLPILVDGAKMPKPEELPDSIKQLSYTNAAVVDAGRDFHQHMERVIRSTNTLLRNAPSSKPSTGKKATWRGSWPFGRLSAVGVAVTAAVVVGILVNQGPSLLSRIGFGKSVEIAVAPLPPPPLIGPSAQQGTAVAIGQRVALVIGNSRYANVPHIRNSINDANSVAQMFTSMGYSGIRQIDVIATTLKDAGFDVVDSRHDLTAADTRRVLRDFADGSRDADIAVLYYAGHGIEVDGSNYLIPVDAKLERDTDVYDEALSLDRVLLAIEPAKKLRLVILDACRDNPFSKTMKRTIASRGIGQGLARVEPTSPNTLIAFAAKAGQVSSDGDGGNGPYAMALTKHLPTPGVDVRILLGRVRDEVLRMTGSKQEPFIYGSLGGEDVALVGKSNTIK
jgi:hypothetical protein